MPELQQRICIQTKCEHFKFTGYERCLWKMQLSFRQRTRILFRCHVYKLRICSTSRNHHLFHFTLFIPATLNILSDIDCTACHDNFWQKKLQIIACALHPHFSVVILWRKTLNYIITAKEVLWRTKQHCNVILGNVIRLMF
jgi:hypothetical protein